MPIASRPSIPSRALVAGILVAALSGCGGASSTEIRTARTSRYTCDDTTVIDAAIAGVEAVFPPLGPVDRPAGLVTSEFRWYSADGSRRERGTAHTVDRDVSVAAVVQLRRVEGGIAIVTRANVNQIRDGLAAGVPLEAGSSEWPKWVDGKLDVLAVDIHERLGACAVPLDSPVQHGAPGAAPAPAPDPAAPAEPVPPPLDPNAPAAPPPSDPTGTTPTPAPPPG